MGSIGLSIQNYYQKIEKNWVALQKVSVFSLKSFSLYAKFKNEIFDDKNAKLTVLARLYL